MSRNSLGSGTFRSTNSRLLMVPNAAFFWFVSALLFSSSASGQDGKMELPAPVTLARTTKDGVEIKCTYYGGLAGKRTIPVIMVHDFNGQRGQFDDFARKLQKATPEGTFAILVPDLRAHGESNQGHNSKGQPITLLPQNLKPADFVTMANFDLEAAKKILMEKNNAGDLNINQLAVIGAGPMGSAVALIWTLQDWSWPATLNGKQGQDVAAFVLLSPTKTYKTLNLQNAIKHPFVGGKVSAMIVHGTKEPDAVQIFKQLETKHAPIPKTAEDRVKFQDLFQLELDTEVKGINFLDREFGLNLEVEIYKFLKLRLVNKRDDAAFAWEDRSGMPEPK